ncbi:CDP-glycerol glycerophosphotransferase family protein [Anaeromicropila populeti]|nr:CDP-glycerol glycerophosphotransferase family protein [Anaeromicropila populeti]
MAKKVFLLLYKIERTILPVSENVILFESNVGRNYTGNPKAIYEEMVRQGLDRQYKCCFILEDLQVEIPGNPIKVKRLRWKYFYYFAIAKIWVSDSRFPTFIVKRKGVTYIQTWHGTPLKKLALDMESIHMDGEKSIEDYKKAFVSNTSTWDYLISQNSFSTETFRRCFSFHKNMLEVGYPRNDSLIRDNSAAKIKEWKDLLGLPADKKILLYAPTWRDNEYYGENLYKFYSNIDYDRMRKELGGEYIMIVKYHYLVKDHIDWSCYADFIYKFDSAMDITSLYLVSDCLITDYSSVMFDYSILKRPMFFYAYDLENYKNNLRGFYFDFMKEVPGPVSRTTEELIYQIKNYEFSQYTEKYEIFLKKFNSYDDGKASERVVELLKNIMEDGK